VLKTACKICPRVDIYNCTNIVSNYSTTNYSASFNLKQYNIHYSNIGTRGPILVL
jgi:hypothetical protein